MKTALRPSLAIISLLIVSAQDFPGQKLDLPSPLRIKFSTTPPLPPELAVPILLDAKPNDLAVQQSLAENLISLDFQDTGLNNVLNHLADELHLNILIDRLALDDEGISPDVEVTIKVSSTAAKTALEFLVQQLDLCYVIRGGCVVVTSELEGRTVFDHRVYPIADLTSPNDPKTRDDDVGSLIELIESNVDSDSWQSVGGDSSISNYPGSLSLIISQTPSAHEKVSDFLKLLRKSKEISKTLIEGMDNRGVSTDRKVVFGAVSDESEAIQEKLQNTIVSFQFQKAPLAEVAEVVSNRLGVPIFVDWTALEDEGIARDTPVTISLRDVTVEDALLHILSALNATWVLNKTLSITSELQAGQELVLRSYPIADLVMVEQNGFYWSLYHNDLLNCIESIVSPASWFTVGGQGSVVFSPTCQSLLVNQTRQVHQRIEKLLRGLRKAQLRLDQIQKLSKGPSPAELNRLQLKQAAEEIEAVDHDSLPDGDSSMFR